MRTVGAATELLPPGAARTRPWYDARRQGITASEIAVVLGLSRWDSPLSLYFQKRGELDGGDDDDDYRFALGRELEPYVLRCFTDLTGIELDECGLAASQERPWQLATPDAVCGNIPVEGKTAVSEDFWGSSGSSVIPLYYRCQLLQQMDVLGADHGYMCVVFLRSGEPRWYEVAWDPDDIGVIRQAGAEFLQRVADGDPPDADGSDATTQALRRRYRSDDATPAAVCSRALRRSYMAALKARSTGDERYKLAANKVRQAMGTSARLLDPDGEIVATKRGPKGALYPGRGMIRHGRDSQDSEQGR
jgi:putative phage-type endonuclease